METIVHRKLVRDRIPEIIRNAGGEPVCRALSHAERREALRNKLCEEAEEFRQSGEMEELADMLEVLLAILNEENWPWEALEKERAEKCRARGGFAEGIWLEEVRKEKT